MNWICFTSIQFKTDLARIWTCWRKGYVSVIKKLKCFSAASDLNCYCSICNHLRFSQFFSVRRFVSRLTMIVSCIFVSDGIDFEINYERTTYSFQKRVLKWLKNSFVLSNHLGISFCLISYAIIVIYAVTESVNTQQDNISYGDNALYLIPRSHFLWAKCNLGKYNLQSVTCNLS